MIQPQCSSSPAVTIKGRAQPPAQCPATSVVAGEGLMWLLRRLGLGSTNKTQNLERKSVSMLVVTAPAAPGDGKATQLVMRMACGIVCKLSSNPC
jgi:hypothetical protein